MTTDPLRHRIWLAATLLLIAVKIWFTRGQGVYAIGSAGLDDRLFLELAQHLVRGDWLGPYSVLTLAKGPAYPLFIAAAFLIGLPLFVAQHLLYAGGCLAFTRALFPAIRSHAARFCIFALLLCNPMTFDAPGMGRVLRQHIYGPLALIIFAGLIALYLRREKSLRANLPWLLLLGFSSGFFYLTREETVWIMPGVLLLAGACLWGAWRVSRPQLRTMAVQLALAAGCAAVPVFTVSALNYTHYGWFGTCEFRAAAFRDAYGAMSRVQVGQPIPSVPVPRETRAAMARVSPAFAEIQSEFDQGLARSWASHGSFFTGRPAEEEQIGGGWFMWALREAVSDAGHTDDAAKALAFYRRLADEINAACDDGRLPAGPARSGFAPVWGEGDTGRLLDAAVDFTAFVTHFRHFGAIAPPSTGSTEELQLFRDLTRERLRPPEGELDVVGAKRYVLNLWKANVLHQTGKSLRFILLGLVCVAGAFSFVGLLLAGWRRRWSYPLTLAAAAAGVCAASILIHAAIEATSFPVKSVTSFAPIYPLLLVFVVAAFWDACLIWRDRRQFFRTPVLGTAPLPDEKPAPPETWRARLLLPSSLGVVALLPFLLWQGEFRKLFWFGDSFFLLDQLAAMGFGAWTLRAFAENFVPLFKLLWGGAALGFGGSYLAMLWLLWLTHAVNTAVLVRWLRRAGFSPFVTTLSAGVFALAPTNLETLGWTVQWSAVLATGFMLQALWWFERRRHLAGRLTWSTILPLLLLAAASACSFSRGVLTGGVLAAAFILPLLLARQWQGLRARLPAAALCLLPSIAVTLVIMTAASGNHQHLAGQWTAVIQFAASYFLLNPFYACVGDGTAQPLLLILLAGLKFAVLLGGLRCARGRARQVLWLLLIYDLGNALLIGIGRHHTGFLAAMSSRYQYSSLLATLPFAALLLEQALHRLPAVRLRRGAAAAIAAILAIICLAGWPGELRTFTGWRGSELRALMAAPATDDPAVRVPGLEYMHIERAKALQRAFNLH
ncbi:MAG: hypothetical protein H3C27_11015 [Opitutaceae bacterium]|nr:hypothetical protein [Opitutaceae bacterium]